MRIEFNENEAKVIDNDNNYIIYARFEDKTVWFKIMANIDNTIYMMKTVWTKRGKGKPKTSDKIKIKALEDYFKSNI